MEFTSQQQLLLDALKTYPPGLVYTDAERRRVFRGFKLYNDEAVEDITWDDQGPLVVNVLSGTGKSYPVRVSRGGRQGIGFHCPCGSDDETEKCQHVICALITLINLVKPSVFRMGRENIHRREHLLAALMRTAGAGLAESALGSDKLLSGVIQGEWRGLKGGAASRAERPFCIVLEESARDLKVHLERNGERVEPFQQAKLLKPDLLYFMSLFKQDNLSLPQPVFLRKWVTDYPIIYRDGTGDRLVTWLENPACAIWMEFDVSGKEVVLSKKCGVGEDLVPAELMGNFAFIRAEAKICLSRVEKDRGWKLWRMIRAACFRESSGSGRIKETEPGVLRIPRDLFRNFQIMLDDAGIEKEAYPSIVYKVEGFDSAPRVLQASGYRLAITEKRENKNEFLISPECRAGDYTFVPSRKILSFARAMEWGRVPASLRTRRRKPILFDAFFQALTLQDRKGRDETLKKTVNDTTFGQHKLATLARRLIRGSIEEWKSGGMQLHLIDGKWSLMAPNRDKESLLFLIPYRLFGFNLFEKIILKDSEMIVKREDLFKRLYALQQMAGEAGIEVFLNGLPVESARWELDLDATDSTIDWFEIRPEIRCNGTAIERGLLEEALIRKGVVVQNGVVRILDESTLNKLAAIAGLSETGRTSPREIVTVQRHRIIELFSLRRQGINVKLSRQDEEIIEKLTQFDRIAPKPIPTGIRTDLRDYQKRGYYWLSFLYEHKFGACLADDMGLGKTIQAIAFLGAIKEGKVASIAPAYVPSLVVVPPSLIFNWQQELEKFYPDLRVYVYQGKERSLSPKGYDVIITSYGLIRRDIKTLKESHFNVIIFDEAQAIKNIFADTTGAVRQLKGRFKVALTGTPVENHMGEYYSIMDLVLPGLLGEHKAFQAQAKQDVSSFLPFVAERTKPFVLRRTKEHILKELPAKIERDVYLELTETQKKFYNKTVAEVRATIDDAYRGKSSSQAKIIALTAIMKLRQICLTPKLLVPDMEEVSPKVDFLVNKLGELSSEAHSSLVFSQFTSFLDVVEGVLRSRGFLIFRLDGSTPVVKRKEVVESFQGSESPAVFLLSLKAGGQGLNLTRASYVFHLDPWWNPAVESQASDRSHRIGQKNKVIVTRLIMRHTVEEKMMALKQRKLLLYRALMDAPENSAGRSITREDFNFLLGPG
jgi:superfamily II DNA or RNA helicase